ncbi:signal peptidase I [uncultured Desulfobacter sp.]|uniref:signal peptidase I n=1 Tax=uncultured Desulfobacter sp. TaxID=240139 RepID=UPI002AAA997B|nr:signal peptidase I [uncultured Desulfobacter sp.]
MSKKKKNAWRENIEAILVAVVIALFIRTFIVQAFKIPSGSMLETLQIGDQILVNKFIYGVKIPFTNGKVLIPVKDPQRNDIVVFKYPEDPSKDYIKRVIAVAGDTLEIVNKKLYVNDKLVTDQPWAQYKDFRILPAQITTRDNYKKITVPANKLFVMGDNRDNSHDSRFWGFVDLSEVRGEAIIIYWSWDKANFSARFNRIGTLLF